MQLQLEPVICSNELLFFLQKNKEKIIPDQWNSIL